MSEGGGAQNIAGKVHLVGTGHPRRSWSMAVLSDALRVADGVSRSVQRSAIWQETMSIPLALLQPTKAEAAACTVARAVPSARSLMFVRYEEGGKE